MVTLLMNSDLFLQCNIGFAGDGYICGEDFDIDGVPDKPLDCSGSRCLRVCKVLVT